MADIIDELVEKITRDLKAKQAASPAAAASMPSGETDGYTTADYPFLEKHPDIVSTPTGKPISAVTMLSLIHISALRWLRCLPRRTTLFMSAAAPGLCSVPSFPHR